MLACGRRGHTTYAPDEPELRAQLAAPAAAGEVWRCLRCGAFVPGPPTASGPASQAPVVPRGKEIRSQFILKVFAVERFLRALIFGAASYFLWRFRSSHTSIEQAFNRELPLLRDLFKQLGFDIDHSKLVGLLRHALTLSGHSITLLAVGAAAYAAIELVEAIGLWQARRWGEYFAMVATSLGLPLEIYDLTRNVTVTALVLLGVNLALVLYLAITKRLFGIRGGRHAYDERLREESVLEAAAEAAARRQTTAVPSTSGPAGAQLAAPAPGQPDPLAAVRGSAGTQPSAAGGMAPAEAAGPADRPPGTDAAAGR